MGLCYVSETMWAPWETEVSKTKQGTCSHGELWGRQERIQASPLCVLGQALYSCIHSLLLAWHVSFNSSLIWKPGSQNPMDLGPLDQHTKERTECPALMKLCPADSAPSAKERKAGLPLLPKLSDGVGFFPWPLMCSFWDLLIAMRCNIKYGRESLLQLKVTSRSP